MADRRSRNQLQQAVAVTMRALSAPPAGSSARPAPAAGAPESPPPPGQASLAVWRGEADAAALRLKGHDATLHGRLRPASRRAAEIFDLIEDARALAAGCRHLPGAQANLSAWLTERCHAEPQEAARRRAELLCAAWHLFVSRPPPAPARPLPAPVQQALAGLCSLLTDQQAFAAQAKSVALQLAHNLPAEPAPPADLQLLGHQSVADLLFAQSANDAPRPTTPPPKPTCPPPRQPRARPEPADYRVYTRAFDEILDASALASEDDLAALRRRLDRRLAPWQPLIARLALRLERRLLGMQRRDWTFEQEDGRIDNRALPRAVARPGFGAIYKRESDCPFPDTQVCLLIDNSASMRGGPIAMAAMCSDILVRVLERCAVRCEVLGFTTRDSEGGRSRRAWEDAGRPPDPGRLTDARHIIYKAAATPYRHARRHLALMLDDRLLQENIDGEALEWACQRLRASTASRKILIVLSDGAPCDPATQAANSDGLLERHLRSVIRHIQADARIDLLAIGIRHDVGRYYPRAVTLREVNELGGALFEQLSQLLTRASPPRL